MIERLGLKKNLATRLLISATLITSEPTFGVATEQACTGNPAQTGTIDHVAPDGTLSLKDGAQFRLVNLENVTPKALYKTLKQYEGANIIAYPSGRVKDHMGRKLAQIFVSKIQGKEDQQAPQTWLQGILIRKGLALATARPGNSACYKALLQEEREARGRRLGIWQPPQPAALFKASDVKRLNQVEQGEFIIVRGRVLKLGRTGAYTYLNFGRNWRTDFTIQISNQRLKRKTLAWPYLKKLIGQEIEVRGWLDHWNGPMIRLDLPILLELQTMPQ